MSVYVESRITFDFSQAVSVIQHDKTSPSVPGGSVHGNSLWPGVDFCIEEANGDWIWLEIKNWDPTHIPPRDRGGSRWSFISKMRSKMYTREMRGKFLGTSAFLAWTGQFSTAATRYILLLEPPTPLDAALLLTVQQRMTSQVPNLSRWTRPIYVAVITVAGWNSRFPDYPAVK